MMEAVRLTVQPDRYYLRNIFLSYTTTTTTTTTPAFKVPTNSKSQFSLHTSQHKCSDKTVENIHAVDLENVSLHLSLIHIVVN